jgi:hypothetical protein
MSTAPRILRLVSLMACVGVIAGHSGGTDGSQGYSGSIDPPVTAIEIVPHQVAVGASTSEPTTFELEARLWSGPPKDRLSANTGSQTLSWTVTASWLRVKSQSGFKAVIEVSKGAGSNNPGFVKVTSAGQTSQPGAKISLVPETVPGEDMVTASYRPDKAPEVIVSNGVPDAAGNPCRVMLSIFVRRTTVGQLVKPCPGPDGFWGTALLSADHGLRFKLAEWNSYDNSVQPSEGPLRVLPLALHVMIGNGSLGSSALATLRDDVLLTASKEIGAANAILAETRAGIELNIASTITEPTSDRVDIDGCDDGDTKTAALDASGVLNVYYVDGSDDFRGLSCTWHQQRLQEVIYIFWEDHTPSTFIHELGHVLGLSLPSLGHPDKVGGFDRTNVMTSGNDDYDPGGRTHLTVGQVFRMNATPGSWINWSLKQLDPVNQIQALDPLATRVREASAPRLSCQCGKDSPPGRCPTLVEDVALRSGRLDDEYTWSCVDQLWLSEVPDTSNEEPVAIAAGRSWGSPPGTCRKDLSGTFDKRWGATFLELPNLTRAGNCSSSVAIFFRHHGPLYLPLPEPSVTWTNAAEEFPVVQVMRDAVPVLVLIHHPAGPAAPAVVDDQKHMRKTFGSFNWSGIALDFKFTTSCQSPNQSPNKPFEFSVCYDNGGAEGKLAGVRSVGVSIPNRKPTTASHFLGRAMGLDQLTSTQQVFKNNIMQQDPAKRGQRLTRGQVYRVNHKLLPAVYQCGTNCPPISADAP